MEAGKEFGIKPIGLGARDTLRLECAMMLYGNDIDDKHTPLDADLEWVVGFDKDFIGKRKLESQKENGTEQKLVAYEMQDSAIARHGYEIVLDGKPIGIVTSGTYSPTLKRAIGLGYVDSHFAGNGNDLAISVRDSLHRALIVNKPFYKRKK
jgi:aminomethyltransferase